MGNQEQTKLVTTEQSPKPTRPLGNMTPEEIVDGLRKAEASLAASEARLKELADEEDTYQFADELNVLEPTYQDLKELSDEELAARVAFFAEKIDQANKRVETNRRGLKLGYLKLANQAPRCSHLRNDGEPCRAPAMGQRSFCVFHSRGYDCETNDRIKFGFLEDDGNLQLVLKQIMEQVLSGRIPPHIAALLLRATQIANGVLKARKSTLPRRKPVRSATQRSQRNPEEFAG